jgi:hypothetical protein
MIPQTKFPIVYTLIYQKTTYEYGSNYNVASETNVMLCTSDLDQRIKI